MKRRTKGKYPINSVRSCYLLDHSPLVGMYIEKNNPSCNILQNKLKMTLSHLPTRPLTTVQSGLIKTVRFRDRHCDDKETLQTIRRGNSTRRSVMQEFTESKSKYVT